MAQLTLSERSQMANNGYFIQRLTSAIRKTANYWNTYIGANYYYASTYKRMQFAKQILQGNVPNMVAYAEYLLSQYNENNPDLITEAGQTQGQVSDQIISDSSASSLTFDFFAGVDVKIDEPQP